MSTVLYRTPSLLNQITNDLTDYSGVIVTLVPQEVEALTPFAMVGPITGERNVFERLRDQGHSGYRHCNRMW